MIKKGKKFILIESEDLILAMQKAKQDGNNILYSLMDLFTSNNKVNDEGLFKVNSDSKVANYLKNIEGVVFEEELITPDVLGIALARSIYECNHEMEKSLKKYLRLLMDTIINKEDKKIVIDLIINDERLIDYINKYDSLESYLKQVIKKQIDVKVKESKEQQVTKNRSHVIM